MAIDFKIDTVTMTNQPTEIRVQPAESKSSQTLDGGFLASKRTKGAVITVTWGVDSALAGAVAELITKRGGTIPHTIAFTDRNSTTWTYDVQWLSDPQFGILVSYHFARFSITLYERP